MGFSLLVALCVAALAFGAGQLLRQSILDSALAGAEQTGQVFAELEMGIEEYEHGELTPKARDDLDVTVKLSSTVLAARVWDRDGALLHRSGPGGALPPGSSSALRTAIRGEAESIAPRTDGAPPEGTRAAAEHPLQVYVPISLGGDRRPRDVVELHLPYAPVQAAIASRTQSLTLALGLGALVFFGALLPTVLRGSSALADLYDARQLPLQRRLRRAMQDGELALVYQPKLELASGRVESVEALLRWRLADGATLLPGEFIPLVEPTAVMGDLTMHVFELAARQASEWDGKGFRLDVAVNISASNLGDEELPSRLAERAAAHGLDPDRFTLEVTESAMSRRPERDLRTVAALRQCGFKLSLDDFGMGESSLGRLHAIEFQEVKIDRSFVRDLESGRDPVLVSRIIDLAQALGARVVGEGIESESAARRLGELGCDAIQGFHLSPPLPAEELGEWLRPLVYAAGSAPRSTGSSSPSTPRVSVVSR